MNCFTHIKGNVALEKHFEGFKDMDRATVIKKIREYEKILHEDVIKFKKEAGIKYPAEQEKFNPNDNSSAIESIKKEYEDKINNIKQQNETAPKEAELSNTQKEEGITVEEPPKNPPTAEEGTAGEGENNKTGIKHADTEEKRLEYGSPEYERNNATDAQLEAQAEKEIKEGYNAEKLIQKLESGVPPTGVENFILKKYLAGLETAFEKNKTDENLKSIERVFDALDKIGSLQSEAFRTRKGLVPTDDNLAGFFINEKAANNDAKLTEKQKETAQKDFEALGKAKKQFEEERKIFEDKVAAFNAEQELAKTKKSSTKNIKKTHEDFVKDRTSIIEAAKEKIRKAKETRKDIHTSGISGRTKLDDLVTIAPEILKLARSYAEEGVMKLSDMVKEIHPIFKDEVEGLTERDIHDVIAGEYSEKKLTKSEVAKRMEDLRIEAQLLNKLDRLENGEEPKKEKEKIKRNQEIEEVRKKIKDYNKQNPDIKSQLDSLKKRNEKETERLKEKIAKGDIAPDVKKTPILQDLEYQKKFPEEFKAALKAKDELIKVRQDIELRRAKQAYENRTDNQKLMDAITKSANVPRTLMASMDLSAPLRQGLVASVAHPILAKKATKFMFEALKDEKVYNRWIDDVHNNPKWEGAKKSGLAVTDPATLHLKNTEEAFLGANYAEQIPIAGEIVKGSERAYVGFLNKLRWDLYNQYADAFEQQGLTPENHPDLYKGIASLVNNSTGRGGMAFGETASPLLSSLLFSPRLIASRMNMLGLSDIPNLGLGIARGVTKAVTLGKVKPDWHVNYGYYSKLPKELRVHAAKDMLTFVALGLTTLALAKAGFGAQVEDDLRSSDFGKIRSGNTRWDIWGGFQPYARVLTQMAMSQRKSANTGKIYELDGKGAFGKSRIDPLLSFARGKLAPIPSAVLDLAGGRDVSGQPVTVSQELITHMIPLIAQDVYSAMQDQGIKALFTAGVPSVFGVGVQTYKPNNAADVFSMKDLQTETFKKAEKIGLSLPNPKSQKSYEIPVDVNHPNVEKEGDKPKGRLTDEEWAKFNNFRKPKIEQAYKDVMKGTYAIPQPNGSVKEYKGENIPKQYIWQVKDRLDGILSSINEQALNNILHPNRN